MPIVITPGASVPLPPFPNVPNLPGVPNVPRSILFPATSEPSLGGEAPADVLFHAANSKTKWGIFDSSNRQVVAPDSVVDFAKRSEWRISNFPVQAGQFASYNKVRVPFDISVRLTKGGSTLDRTTFLQQLDTVAQSLALYTILTPEQSYLGCNVTRVEITRRGKLGAYFIDAEVYFQQIIEVTPQYSSTNAASATADAESDTAIPAQQQGVVQPQAPSPSTVVTATNDLTNGGN